MIPFIYKRPRFSVEAIELMLEYKDRAQPLSGGTDLVVGLRQRKVAPRVVIDLKHLEDTPQQISFSDGHLVIGGTVVMSKIVQDFNVQAHFPGLAEAAAVVGSPQIRNRATLAGNICNASPAADTVPVLAVHGATVTIRGPKADRTENVVDFILRNRGVNLKAGEFVIAVNLPIPTTPYASAFGRITRRRGVDIATVNLCCALDARGTATFAFGAVAPRPLLVRDDTGVFSNLRADPLERDIALNDLISRAVPITDIRAEADYRTAMLKVLAKRAFLKARTRLAGGISDD